MTIREFISKVKADHDPDKNPLIWNDIFRQAGYYHVVSNTRAPWPEMHNWITEHIGNEHYAWSGNSFWFEHHDDAVLFSLRWA